jgi:hypothetical protein
MNVTDDSRIHNSRSQDSRSHESHGSESRSTLEKYLPLLLGLLLAMLAGKVLRKIFWTVFGMGMALHYSGLHPFG